MRDMHVHVFHCSMGQYAGKLSREVCFAHQLVATYSLNAAKINPCGLTRLIITKQLTVPLGIERVCA